MEIKRGNKVLALYLGRRGGGVLYTRELLACMRDRCRLSLMCSTYADTDLTDLSSEPDLFRRVNTFRSIGEMLIFGLPRLLKALCFYSAMVDDSEITLCTMHHIWGLFFAITSRIKGKPYVLIVHDAETHLGDGGMAAKILLWLHIRFATNHIALSNNVRERLMEKKMGIDVPVIPHGILPLLVRRNPIRHPGIGAAFNIVFLGRIIEYKGADILLDAWKMLAVRREDINLLIAGEGAFDYSIDKSYEGRINIINRWISDEEIKGILLSASLICCPYRESTQSGVACLALPAGVPILITPVKGLLEQLKKGVIISRSSDPRDIGDAIESLVDSPDLYNRLSMECLELASELSWDSISKRVIENIETALVS